MIQVIVASFLEVAMRVDTKYTKFFQALSEKTKSAIPLCLTVITLSIVFFGISQAKLKIKGCQE